MSNKQINLAWKSVERMRQYLNYAISALFQVKKYIVAKIEFVYYFHRSIFFLLFEVWICEKADLCSIILPKYNEREQERELWTLTGRQLFNHERKHQKTLIHSTYKEH